MFRESRIYEKYTTCYVKVHNKNSHLLHIHMELTLTEGDIWCVLRYSDMSW
jgi:hypothetical protein